MLAKIRWHDGNLHATSGSAWAAKSSSRCRNSCPRSVQKICHSPAGEQAACNCRACSEMSNQAGGAFRKNPSAFRNSPIFASSFLKIASTTVNKYRNYATARLWKIMRFVQAGDRVHHAGMRLIPALGGTCGGKNSRREHWRRVRFLPCNDGIGMRHSFASLDLTARRTSHTDFGEGLASNYFKGMV